MNFKLIIAASLALHGVAAGQPPGMVWIPGGESTMGSDQPGSRKNEQPAHRVNLDGFWIDSHDVTNREFARFVEETGYVTTAERLTVVLANRTPTTEAQWEFAARGGLEEQRFAWGDEFRPNEYVDGQTSTRASFPSRAATPARMASKASRPSRNFRRNACGLYDVAGNVWEWCSDWYRVDTYARLKLAARRGAQSARPHDALRPCRAEREKARDGFRE
jgi:formylglycine-generating enzyme required for sulfatase activity